MMRSGLRCSVAAARALILFPTYYVLLAIFTLWPWRLGSPFILVRPLCRPREARQTSRLRFLLLRMELRRFVLLGGMERIPIRTVLWWLALPFRHTIPACARHSKQEAKQIEQTSRLEIGKMFFDATVDALQYANMRVKRLWFDSDRRPGAANHIPNVFHVRGCYLLNHQLNPGMPIEQDHHDKYELYAVCSKRGWPTIPVYASFDSGVVTECLTLDDGPLISKPSGSAEGAGHFERWWPETSSDGSSRRYRGEDGAVATYEQVVDRIAERSVDEPYVLQRLVSDHHEIRELSGVEALSAIRLPTCCFPDGRVEALPLLFFRMGTVPGIACSNMAQGGIGYHIDLETGCLERGAKYNSFETFDTHPTTSKRVVGFRLPFWKETVELCKTVHGEGFPTYPSVGWDVAITDDGPVLVEMNIEWAQVNTPNMRFIGETAYTDCMLAHFRKHWPKNCPPPIEA